jgi:ABC-type transport system substrate-binding protein
MQGGFFVSTHVSGTGPFILTEREEGVKLEFKRFADYWDKASRPATSTTSMVIWSWSNSTIFEGFLGRYRNNIEFGRI